MPTLSLSWIDLLALFSFLASWLSYQIYTKHQNIKYKRGLLARMNQVRKQWAISLLERDNRVMDSQVINGLLHKETFFASTTVLIIASSITLFTMKDTVNELAQEVPLIGMESALLWDIKVGTLIIIFVYAFFKFTWSIRQHSYCSALMGAIPQPNLDDDKHKAIAEDLAPRLARLSNLASRHFNDGLRAYYFALAELCWFIHPFLFMLATAWVILVLYRREFHSQALAILS